MPDQAPDRGARIAEPPDRLPKWAMVGMLIVALPFFIALVWHSVASFELFRARDTSIPLDARLSAATTALDMEPFNPMTGAVQGYVVAQRLFAQGQTLRAVDIMAEAYKGAVGDKQMLRFFTSIQDALTLETNRKAHLQHGHEGPGGTLKQSDLER